MTFTNEQSEILKVDDRGRVRTPVARREELLDEFERSGLSGAKFAVMVGVKYPTFALWVQKRRKARAGAKAGVGSGSAISSAGACGSVRLFEAFPEAVAGSVGGMKIELPGGIRMLVDSMAQVPVAAELLRHLAHGRGGC
jgi:hypothetical protein